MTLPSTMLARQSDVYLLGLAKAIYQNLVPNMDMSEQNFPHQLLAPFCLALAQVYIDIEDIERRTSLATAGGSDLDQLGVLYGIDRTSAARATGTLHFTGASGSVISTGYSVTTGGPNPIAVHTLAGGTIPVGGTLDLDAEAVDAGSAGNLVAGTLTYLTSPPPTGVTAVTNAADFTGGTDIQEDGAPDQYLTGYRADIRNLANVRGEGGADKHLRKWTRSVAGVGRVRVVDAYPTNGWVTIVLVGTDMLPASSSLILSVEDFLLDPWRKTLEAESATLSGFGGSTDTQGDGLPAGGSGNTVKFVHSASGAGQATITGLKTTLVQPGIWRMRIRAKRGGSTGTGNCLQFGVYDTVASAYLNTNFGGSTSNQKTLAASALTTTFAEYETEFAWFGANAIEARIIRATADVTTDVWIDEVKFWSTMSRDDRDVGLTPAGMRLSVVAATPITINVAADITYGLGAGQTTGSVNADLHANLLAYFADLALEDENDVRRAAVEDVIFETRGVADVATVTLNTGTANISIAPTEVAVLGTETYT